MTPSQHLHSQLVRYFERMGTEDAACLASYLRESRCELNIDHFKEDEWNHPRLGLPVYSLTLFVPVPAIPLLEAERSGKLMQNALKHLLEEDEPDVRLHVKALLPAEEPRTVGLNNCFFNTEKTIRHDDLRFRSRGEVAIYEELKCRNVLFFPNPAAVLGKPRGSGGKVVKKEPDFLICYKGKWGCLEIDGDEFHSGPIATAKDHDRARLLQHYGLFFV
jgi:hypothetical protein